MISACGWLARLPACSLSLGGRVGVRATLLGRPWLLAPVIRAPTLFFVAKITSQVPPHSFPPLRAAAPGCRRDDRPRGSCRRTTAAAKVLQDLPHIPLHGLRHTHATLLLQIGESPKVVQERLGHASISITMDIYSHVNPTIQRAAADRFAALLQ